MKPIRKLAFVVNESKDGAPALARELSLLARNPGRPFTREAILERVWGWDFIGDSRTVDVHVQRLRRKLGCDAAAIKTDAVTEIAGGVDAAITASASAQNMTSSSPPRTASRFTTAASSSPIPAIRLTTRKGSTVICIRRM